MRTIAAASYRREINRVSALTVSGRLAAIDVISGDEDDAIRVEYGVAYTRALTRDWGLTAGVRRETAFEEGDRTDESNIFSLGLSRSFAFRP